LSPPAVDLVGSNASPMRWICCGLLVLSACGAEVETGFDTPRAAVEALRAAYVARDGEAFLACIDPDCDRQGLVESYFRIPALVAGKDDDPVLTRLRALEVAPANLGRVFALLDEFEVAGEVFASMPGGIESYRRPDPTFVYGLFFPGPWSFERVVSRQDDSAVVQVHQRSRGHDLRVLMPLRAVDDRWYAVAPDLGR